MRKFALLSALAFTLFCSETLVYGQDSDFAVKRVTAEQRPISLDDKPGHWIVEITFTHEYAKEDLQQSLGHATFQIFDLTAPQVRVVTAGADKAEGSAKPNPDHPRFFTLTLPQDALDAQRSYVIYIVGFLRSGTPVADLHGKLEFISSAVPVPNPVPAPNPAPAPRHLCNGSFSGHNAPFKLGISKSKDDSDIYLSGEIDVVARTDKPGDRQVNGIADVKLGYPFFCQAWGHVQLISPQFNLQASSVPNHDPNAMDFGVLWDSPLTWKTFWIFRKEFKVESNKNFTNADDLGSLSVRLPLSDARVGIPHVFPTLLAGGEFGKNFQSPLAAAEGGSIVRGIFGLELNYFFDLSKISSLKGIGLDGAFARRVFATREVIVDDSDPKNLALVAFGRKPRDHAKADLKFAISDNFGLTVGYEWGSLPPSYQFVHHLVKVGLLYQAQVKPR